jgi:hypothetical protein
MGQKKTRSYFTIWFLQCPGQDSNLHTLASTSPSSWRVYQFHHLGGLAQSSELRAESSWLRVLPCALRSLLCAFVCAQNRTRTCTSLLTLVPETSASTNFAIWASLFLFSHTSALCFKDRCCVSGCKNKN